MAGRGTDRRRRGLASESVSARRTDAETGAVPEETSGWNVDDSQEIMVGHRRKRAKRRRTMRRSAVWGIVLLAVALAAGGFAAYRWLNRPTGLATLPNPAVVAPGGFRASIGDNNTITVGLEVRSLADAPLTLVSARVAPPAGLTTVAVTLMPPGEGNEGFALEGDLPALRPVTLGTNGADRNAVLAARFTVECGSLPATDGVAGEQIFVTIRLGDEQRVEELTPPVVDDVPWLTATARRVCSDPVPTTTPEPPLPPLPTSSPTAGNG